ncbi:MAG: hypothetical protein K2H64_07010 [Desulfovibrio sp.]|nr:hypothetical protein [Desulfovibrio sp.]
MPGSQKPENIYTNLALHPAFAHYDIQEIIAVTSKRRDSVKDMTLVMKERENTEFGKILKRGIETPAAYRMEYKGLVWDYLWAPKPGSAKLYVVFSASKLAADPWPVYRRHSWHRMFDGHVLYLSEPLFSLYPDLLMAWYLGLPALDLYPYIAVMATAIARECVAEEIFSYGSSSGGLAALKFAEYAKAKAIAINPQIFLDRFAYFQSFSEKTGFKSASLREERTRVNISKKNRYFIIQNDADAEHCERHVYPLLRDNGIYPKYGLAGKDNLWHWQYLSLGGHNGQKNERILPIILYLASCLPPRTSGDLADLDNLAISVSDIMATLAWQNSRIKELAAKIQLAKT